MMAMMIFVLALKRGQIFALKNMSMMFYEEEFMSKWGTACWVRQTICEQVGEDFYEIYGKEIINFFTKLHDVEVDFSETDILSYCLGVFLREGQQINVADSFRLFADCFLDGEGLHNG